MFALTLLSSIAYSHANLVECTACVVVFSLLTELAGEPPGVILKDLDNFCDLIGQPTIQSDCKYIASKLAPLGPGIAHFLSFRAYDANNICAFLNIGCTVHCCEAESVPEQVRMGIYDTAKSIMSFTWVSSEPTPLPQQYVEIISSTDANNRPLPLPTGSIHSLPPASNSSTSRLRDSAHSIDGLSPFVVHHAEDDEPFQCGNMNFNGSKYMATTTTYTAGSWSGYIHCAYVHIPPTTFFSYTVGTPNSRSRPIAAVTPTLNPAAILSLIAIADLGTDTEGNNTIAQLKDILQDPKSPPVDPRIQFLLHTGDMAYADGVESRWDEYGRKVDGFTSALPIITVPGNHEIVYNFTSYKTRYIAAGSEVGGNDGAMYHTLTLGPMMYVGISTEGRENDPYVSNEQLAWVENALKYAHGKVKRNRAAVRAALSAAAADVAAGRRAPLTTDDKDAIAGAAVDGPVWLVVAGHRPLYCSGPGGFPLDHDDCSFDTVYLQARLEALFTTYGVDVVIAGHRHCSERSYPVCFSNGIHTIVNQTSPDGPWNATGCPMYIISGAAGNREDLELRFNNPAPQWSVQSSRKTVYSFGYVTVGPYRFTHSLFASDNVTNMIDSITLVQS